MGEGTYVAGCSLTRDASGQPCPVSRVVPLAPAASSACIRKRAEQCTAVCTITNLSHVHRRRQGLAIRVHKSAQQRAPDEQTSNTPQELLSYDLPLT